MNISMVSKDIPNSKLETRIFYHMGVILRSDGQHFDIVKHI